jgi:hypothetical protein
LPDDQARYITTYEPPGLAKRLLGRALVAAWARLQPPPPIRQTYSNAPSDNVQHTMNLIMPLRDPSPAGRATLLQFFAAFEDVTLPGLRNVGVVHFARFDILDDKLCLFTIYDGDLASYVRDFIVSVGAFFNNLFGYFIKDPPPLPVEQNVEAFVSWVDAHDLPKLPESFSEVASDVRYLPRRLTTLLHNNPNIQIFAYSNYPAVTAAQIRDALHVGW